MIPDFVIPDFVRVSAGRFLMGSPDDEPGRLAVEGPQHWVTIAKPFGVSKFAITVAEFEAFTHATGYPVPAICKQWDGSAWREAHGSFRDPGFAQSARHPAVCVSWHDAKAYAAWLSSQTARNFRLLTEAEWEYAARAGSQEAYWWGNSIAPDQANYNAQSLTTVAVDSYAPNPWGLYQMHGNVWEWLEDGYAGTYADAPCDGSARTGLQTSKRVLRGGGWNNGPNGVRAARRHAASEEFRRSDVGFRIAESL